MQTIEAELIESFLQINRYFQDHQLRYCLIGGIAAGYWGVPRYTKDMDFTVVSLSGGLKPLMKQMIRDGFKVVEKGSSQIQVVQKGSLHFQADIILVEMDYQDWVVQRAKPVSIFGITVPICSPEDLIILKLIANRRQDLLDVENILKAQGSHLDRDYLNTWISFWELEERFKSFSV